MEEISLDKLDSDVLVNSSTPSNLPPPPITTDLDNDLELLIDPNKSRQNSPKSATQSTVTPSITTPVPAPVAFKQSPPSSANDDMDFKINVSRTEDRPSIAPSSSFEKNTTNSMGSFNIPTIQVPEDNGAEKQELLFKLKRLESRGIPLSKYYTNSSSVDEMRDEYNRIKQQRDLENSIKFQRKSMMAFASGVEFLNSKFDPFDIKLDGWSESLHENLTDYDDVFEELHEKYKSKSQIAPELKLLMMMGGSAVMFHMTNSLFKNAAPGMEDILKQNPDLARQFAAASVASTTQNAPGLGNLMNDMMNQGTPQVPTFIPPQPSFVPEAPPPPGVMSGPKDQDVERILNQINEFNDSVATNPIPQPDKDINLSIEAPVKRKRGRPRKQPVEEVKSFSLNI
tara:strand:+ start:7722 stop:8915 length:1194 start_codon:yes stop_codon:yes gene_type:complete